MKIEMKPGCIHMLKRLARVNAICRPCWCPQTKKRQPCWCSQLIFWELNSILMQTLPFVWLKNMLINHVSENTILHLFYPTWILFCYECQFQGNCACVNKMPVEQYHWTRCQSILANDVPRDFGPVIAFVR